MTEQLTAEVVDRLDRAEALASSWDDLADRLGAGPLVRPAYCLSWWRHLGPGRLLLVVVTDASGSLLALAPLHVRNAGPVEVVRWLGHGLGTVSEVLVEPGRDDAAALVWRTVTAPRRLLDLVESRADSPAIPVLEEMGRSVRGRRTRVEPRDACPIIDLEGDGLAHVRRPGAKNLRKVLKRADAALVSAGRVHRVEVARDVAGFEVLLRDVRTVFDAAEAHQPRQHLLEPPYADFVLDYLRGELGAGRAVALVGYLDEDPISFLLAMITPATGTLSLWISRFLPTSSAISPGHLLLRAAFTWGAGHGITRIDQLLGVSQTKRQWSSGTYATVDVRHGAPWAGLVVDAATRSAAALKGRGAP